MSNRSPVAVKPRQLRALMKSSPILIVAAGFEDRAAAVVTILDKDLPQRTVVVRYVSDIEKNAETFDRIATVCVKAAVEPKLVDLDANRTEGFAAGLGEALAHWLPAGNAQVVVDITALPMQAIITTLAVLRELVPTPAVTVLYTEALKYYPEKSDVLASRRERSRKKLLPALSEEMAGNLIPKSFGGSSLCLSTCLLLFAGYEKHRSFGAVDELNPAKLVLLLGRPDREDRAWRLEYSRNLHDALKSSRLTSEEVVSTLDPWASLMVLDKYYKYLFPDHNFAIAPVCSKMQAVAVYLFWEQYRDVQLVFPQPVRYLPNRYSEGFDRIFRFELPNSAEIGGFLSVARESPEPF